ncbi:MAG: prepilin-type N-terminal cleavage/methylation domain-containing protein [Planctomycetales bacterium]
MPPGGALLPVHDCRARGGFTLLELLLVLVILAVAAGLVWVNVQGFHQRHRLGEAAEQVRKHLTAARLRAIETGVIHQFRYEAGGGGYRIAPFEPMMSGADGTRVLTMTEQGGALPETMRFESPEAGANSWGPAPVPPAPVASPSSNLTVYLGPGPALGGAAAWSPPVLFAPDGTATDAALAIVDETGQRLEISVRGLTGAATVGGAAP